MRCCLDFHDRIRLINIRDLNEDFPDHQRDDEVERNSRGLVKSPLRCRRYFLGRQSILYLSSLPGMKVFRWLCGMPRNGF